MMQEELQAARVEMILRDTQVDPKVGVDAAKALVDLEKVPVLLGGGFQWSNNSNPHLSCSAGRSDGNFLLFLLHKDHSTC